MAPLLQPPAHGLPLLDHPGSGQACAHPWVGPRSCRSQTCRIPPWGAPQGGMFWDSGLGCSHPGVPPGSLWEHHPLPCIMFLLDLLWDAFVLFLGLP